MPLEDDISAGDPPQSDQVTPDQFSGGGEGAAEATSPVEPAAPPQVEPQSIRGLIGSLGYQLGDDVADDYGALVHLIQRASQARELEEQRRQADVYTQLGRQLAPEAARIQQALGRPAAQERKPYQPPPFNPDWERLVQVDDQTGRYVGRHPNVPQAIVDAANDYGQWMRGFMQNPMAVFEQYSADREQTFSRQIQQAVQQGIQQHQTQQAVHSIARQNAPWFYATDAEGQFIADPVQGGYRISPVGQQYLAMVRRAAGYGIADPVARDEFARTALRPEIAAAQAPAGDREANARVAADRQGRALSNSRPRTNPLQALTREQRQQTPGAIEPDRPQASLRDMFRERFDEEGIQDQHIAAGAYGA